MRLILKNLKDVLFFLLRLLFLNYFMSEVGINLLFKLFLNKEKDRLYFKLLL